ncbi:hypothetical protein [Xanthomonas campestris]|nr:hypothetical protein [Xanthomonas campestris]WDK04549.1 hypothetical protein JH273_21665 [Xanthomonas campestris]
MSTIADTLAAALAIAREYMDDATGQHEDIAAVDAALAAHRSQQQTDRVDAINVWLSFRISNLTAPTTVPWAALAAQFGQGSSGDERGLLEFRRTFLPVLEKVLAMNHWTQISHNEDGLVLQPQPISNEEVQ